MNIPVLHSRGSTLPKAWENSIRELYKKGVLVKSQHSPQDLPSLDCTMIMEIIHPTMEPRIHKYLPASLEDLYEYVLEVVEGTKDHLSDQLDYTYHRRLTAHPESGTNQIEYLIETLTKTPHSRRAQAITWASGIDTEKEYPPCLQRVWFRLLGFEGRLTLNANTHWRSRDALKAAFMNSFAISELQKYVCVELSRKLSKPVVCGRIVDISDSYHIYGKDIPALQQFLDSTLKRKFVDRTWTTDYMLEQVRRNK
jgi:thymidylate synthase